MHKKRGLTNRKYAHLKSKGFLVGHHILGSVSLCSTWVGLSIYAHAYAGGIVFKVDAKRGVVGPTTHSAVIQGTANWCTLGRTRNWCTLGRTS